MDRNLLLAFALSFLVLSLWTMFTESPAPQRAPDAQSAEGPLPETTSSESAATPSSAPALPPAQAVPEAPPLVPATVVAEGEAVEYETDLYRATLDTLGASLRHWELRNFDTGPRHGREPVVLTTGGPSFLTPFDELEIGNLATSPFELENPDANTFAFTHERDGVVVRKTYRFDPDSYAFRIQLEVENRSQAAISPRFLISLPASEAEGTDFTEQALSAFVEGSLENEMLQGLGKGSFFGGSATTVYDFGESAVDWGGVGTTYFLTAAIPDQPTRARAQFIATTPGQSGYTRIFFEPTLIPPGQSAAREYRGYLGPKEVERLEKLGNGLVNSIDLGWSWMSPVTRFFVWLLHALHEFVPNYGVAIIILTILVRVVTAPLTTRQMKSMERMRELQPKLKELQAKYADDRQKQSEETMKLYRSEGVNPLGGCFPMLLQLPVMIGLFYALRSSIQLRQAPFVGWIDDLSAPETLFTIPGLDLPIRLLPLIMGGTMVLQQRMTPMNIDPAQARMMMTVMPIMMTFLFYQFASGLVLYWMVGNVLAIAHQLWIRRQQAAKE